MMYHTKKELRQYIRNKKREFTNEELVLFSESIISKVLRHPKLMEADTILAYYSLPDEVNTHTLVDKLVSMGKRVLLPKVISDTEISLHEYKSKKDLSLGSYNIMEPNTPKVSSFEFQVSLIPGMAFDKQGHRLGRGKGYYDRLLSPLLRHAQDKSSSHLSPLSYKIGVCFSFQLVEEVPHNEYDIIMDEVIS